MTALEYYKQLRAPIHRAHRRGRSAVGMFPAGESLRMARECAELDAASIMAKRVPPAEIWHETLHDGSNPLKLSRGILCF